MDDINHNGMPDDHEAKMARADLYKLANYSMKLFKMIQEGDQLEGWVQAKITKAADYIASVYHFMEYEMKISEYGDHLESAEMYSESVRRAFEQKLMEAKACKAKMSKKAEKDLEEAKGDEPAAPDESAVARRKRLQALKDKQEDERAERDSDEPKSAVRKVAGKAYGGAKQKEVDESAKPDESLEEDDVEGIDELLQTAIELADLVRRGYRQIDVDDLIDVLNATYSDNQSPAVEQARDLLHRFADKVGNSATSGATAKRNYGSLRQAIQVLQKEQATAINEVSDETVGSLLKKRGERFNKASDMRNSTAKYTPDSQKKVDANYATAKEKYHGAQAAAGKRLNRLGGSKQKDDQVDEASTGDYSAKKARAGKDIGKPGKNFEKIAKSAGERYGSKERGEKVAGAVLAKLRNK